MELRIEEYKEDKYFQIWDDFVLQNSINGTVFHSRKFLSYHPKERFLDKSILLFDKNKLVAVFLAAEINGEIISHPGTSAGGVVLNSKYNTIVKTKAIIDTVFTYYSDFKMKIKVSESIYFEGNNNGSFLYNFSQKLEIYPEISLFFDLKNTDNFVDSISRSRVRSGVRKELKSGFSTKVAESESDYMIYHDMLSKNLEKFGTKPVHDKKDFIALSNLIKENQKLILGLNDKGDVIAGVWVVKPTNRVWHAQYIAQNYDLTTHYSLASLIVKIAKISKEEGANYFNLGIVTEEKGNLLNSGLADFKESLGTLPVSRYIFESK